MDTLASSSPAVQLPANFDTFYDDVQGELARERTDDDMRNSCDEVERLVKAVTDYVLLDVYETRRFTAIASGRTLSTTYNVLIAPTDNEADYVQGTGTTIEAATRAALALLPVKAAKGVA